jgi:hypothetical protein
MPGVETIEVTATGLHNRWTSAGGGIEVRSDRITVLWPRRTPLVPPQDDDCFWVATLTPARRQVRVWRQD